MNLRFSFVDYVIKDIFLLGLVIAFFIITLKHYILISKQQFSSYCKTNIENMCLTCVGFETIPSDYICEM